jgi:hypothetical protein
VLLPGGAGTAPVSSKIEGDSEEASVAVIHKTTLVPTKLELLTAWLPSQPWYAGGEDGPAGDVGIEIMGVNDVSGPVPVTYVVPLTYRGAPLEGADDGLVGTTEHGVLGQRWVYDGAYDPVFVAAVVAFVNGTAEAQAQRVTDTPDPTVGRAVHAGGPLAVAGPLAVETGTAGTDVAGLSADSGAALLHIVRVLGVAPAAGLAQVDADWTGADGAAHRGPWLALAGA